MMRLKLYISMALAVCSITACMDDGKPWTTLEMTSQMTWDADGRLQDDGRFLTSKNYLIEFNELTFVFRELVVNTSSTDSISFDPAEPPPGYTLCHQGHCHNEANQLVPYEEIELELNSGQSGSALVQAINEPIALDTSVATKTYPMTLGACADELGRCVVGPENVNRVGLYLERVVVDAVIEDTGDDTANPLSLTADMTLELQVETQAQFDLGADGPEVLKLALNAQLAPTLWDQFEFSEIQTNSDVFVEAAFKEFFAPVLPKHLAVSVSD